MSSIKQFLGYILRNWELTILLILLVSAFAAILYGLYDHHYTNKVCESKGYDYAFLNSATNVLEEGYVKCCSYDYDENHTRYSKCDVFLREVVDK